jgi:hypothetical protein
MAKAILLLTLLTSLTGLASVGSIKPELVYPSEFKKTKFYIKDGLFVGGDKATRDIVVTDVRFSKNAEYERIVVDLKANRAGELGDLERSPYYQVAVSPDMERLVVTIWGNPKLEMNTSKLLMSLKKSNLIKRAEVLPILEKDRWSFIFYLKNKASVEVFELKEPVRLIVDVKK